MRWEEVTGVGVQDGAREEVTLALRGMGAEEFEAWGLLGTSEEDGLERVVLPALQENAWEVAEFVALAWAERMGSVPAAPLPGIAVDVTWVDLGEDWTPRERGM
ncbi:MAG: hypothetical protein Q4G64_09135 [bacterium]|nr:hypothetical protein [bacterium]